MCFSDMVKLKIEEQRAAMRQLENKSQQGALSKTEQLAYNSHSEVVVGLESVIQELDWLEKYNH